MRHLEVLVVTEKTTVSRVLNWKVTTVNKVEIAIEKLQQRPFKVVAISNEISNSDKRKLQQIVNVLFSNVSVVAFNDTKTLSQTVKAAYWSKNRPAIKRNYLDNSFAMKLANTINLN